MGHGLDICGLAEGGDEDAVGSRGDVRDVDGFLEKWLMIAYERDGK
jgi:hypothetical protein